MANIRNILLRTALVMACCYAPSIVHAAEVKSAKSKVTYDEHIRPIFRQHCFSCHNANKSKGSLVLDSYGKALAGGSSGEVVLAGELADSRLWALINHEETPKMPPEQDKLPEAKLALVRAWIVGGALENAGSKIVARKKPAHDLVLKADAGKPTGPPPMPGKLWRQPVVYTQRAAAVTAIATSPWAPLAAVAGQRQIALYHTDDGRLLGILPFAEGTAQVLRFSRSGALLVAGGGHSAQSGMAAVYDVKTGRRIITVGEELDTVLAADIDTTQSMVALAGPQRIVRVYSTNDGSLLYEIKKHTEWVYDLEFSPDGKLLATADRNGAVHVWEAGNGRAYMTLAGHKSAVHALSWRADSKVLATASEDGSVKLWDIKNGKAIRTLNTGGPATAVQFARDGRLVTTGRNRQTKLWKTSGAAERTFETLPDIGLEIGISHDTKHVIAGDWSGKVLMWNAGDGKRLAELPPNPATLAMRIEQTKTAAAASNADLEKKRGAANALAAQVNAKTAELDAARTRFTAMTNNRSKAKLDAAAALREMTTAGQQAQGVGHKLQVARANVAKQQAAVEKSNQQVSQHQATLTEQQTALTKHQQLISQLTSDLTKVQQQLSTITQPAATSQETAKQTAQQLAAQAEAERKALADLLAKTPAEEKAAIQQRLTAKSAAASQLKQKAELAAKQAKTAQQQVATQAKLVQDKTKSLNAAKQQQARLGNKVQQATSQLTKATNTATSHQKSLAAARQQVEQQQQAQNAVQQKKQTAQQRTVAARKTISDADAKLPGLKKQLDALTKLKATVDKQHAASDALRVAAENSFTHATTAAKSAIEEKQAFEQLPTRIAAALAESKSEAEQARQAAAKAATAKAAAEAKLSQAEADAKQFAELYGGEK